MSHNNDEEIEKLGHRWLFFTLLIAVGFGAFLKHVDDTLTYSDREKVLGATLYELRLAQTTLDSRVTDPRQLADFAHTTSSHHEAPHH